MTEINQANGRRPTTRPDPYIPGQREPQDAVPPGVWRGTGQTDPTSVADGRATRPGLVRRAITHPRTRTVIRQGAYVLVGAHQTARKRHQARTLHTRMIRAAEAVGDHAAVAEWAERHAKYRQERHTRRMTLLTAPVHVARALVVGGGITLAGLITLGIVLGMS